MNERPEEDRMQIVKCPTAYCAPSQQGYAVSEHDASALRVHAQMRDAKSIRAAEIARQRMIRASEHSPRNKKGRI